MDNYPLVYHSLHGISVALCVVLLAALVAPARAQQRIGYVDMAVILEQMPAYRSVQEKIDQKVQAWEQEIEQQQTELDERRRTFQARKLLFTDEERSRRRKEIEASERALEQQRKEYFGPEGKLYALQKRLLRPLQERVLQAVETVAQTQGYGYVLDKSGEVALLYAREQHNLTDDVLRELGINLDTNATEEGR